MNSNIIHSVQFCLFVKEKMNHINSFSRFLQDGISLTQARQRDAITTHGYNTARGLVDTYTEGVKEVFSSISRANRDINNAAHRVIIREQVKQRFYGARSEFLMRLKCNAPITQAYLTGLDTDDVDEFVRKHNEWKEFREAANSMTLPSVSIPKLTKSNWKLYSQAIKELLTRQRGTNNIPLIYVIREANGVYDDPYASTEEQLIQCIALSGGNYQSDNSSVWSLLQEHSIGTEAESIVNRFEAQRDGRGAWLALLSHMESTSYMDNVKSAAMAKLNNASYSGEKKNFGIVKYYQLHSEAHNDLYLAGEPLSDGMKITHFLQGLKDDTAMNFAISSKAEQNVNTFEEFYNSFSAKLSTKLTLTRQSNSNQSQRSINQMTFGNRQGRGRGNRGGGRDGNNNSRGGGRGNCRGGRSGGRFRHDPSGCSSWRPRTTEYSDDEWRSLSHEQRQRVHDLRNHLRNNNDGNQGNHQRQVQQMQQNDDGTIPSQVQLPPPPSNQSALNAPDANSVRGRSGRAGDAFSSGANQPN